MNSVTRPCISQAARDLIEDLGLTDVGALDADAHAQHDEEGDGKPFMYGLGPS